LDEVERGPDLVEQELSGEKVFGLDGVEVGEGIYWLVEAEIEHATKVEKTVFVEKEVRVLGKVGMN